MMLHVMFELYCHSLLQPQLFAKHPSGKQFESLHFTVQDKSMSRMVHLLPKGNMTPTLLLMGNCTIQIVSEGKGQASLQS